MVSSVERKSYNDDDELTLQEVAAYLGISKPTAAKLIDAGTIIGGRIGNKYRALFKFVREYREKILFRGERTEVQTSLPLSAQKAFNDLKKRKKASKTKKP